MSRPGARLGREELKAERVKVSAKNARIASTLGWMNLAIGSGLVIAAPFTTLALVPAGIAMTTVGTSVFTILRSREVEPDEPPTA